MDKKYELTKYTITISDHVLHRIRAIRDLNPYGSNDDNIRSGDLGGYIESELNLSHDGSCWVYDDSCVYENAQVYGNAWVSQKSIVHGEACIYGGATVAGNSLIYGDVHVYDNAHVSNESLICGRINVCGNTKLEGGLLNSDGQTRLQRMKFFLDSKYSTKQIDIRDYGYTEDSGSNGDHGVSGHSGGVIYGPIGVSGPIGNNNLSTFSGSSRYGDISGITNLSNKNTLISDDIGKYNIKFLTGLKKIFAKILKLS